MDETRPACPVAARWQMARRTRCRDGVHPVYRLPATVRLRVSADGSVLVQAVANEIGGGTATVQIQHVADRMGVPIANVGDANRKERTEVMANQTA